MGTSVVSNRLSGKTMVDRALAGGYLVRLGVSEAVNAGTMLYLGLVLMPGGIPITPNAQDAIAHTFPPDVWALVLLFTSTPQLVGMTLAFTGLMVPLRRVRVFMLALSFGCWVMLALSAGLGGLTLSFGLYCGQAVIAIAAMRRAYVTNDRDR